MLGVSFKCVEGKAMKLFKEIESGRGMQQKIKKSKQGYGKTQGVV